MIETKEIILMRVFISILLAFVLTGCNSVYYKPHTLDTNQTVFAFPGGYSMKRSIKETMDKRGYNIDVGILKRSNQGDASDEDIQSFDIPHRVRYIVNVKERRELLRPIWCAFNGFWWWNFSVSITDKATHQEILSWRGRGCQNSSVHKLNAILDELEK